MKYPKTNLKEILLHLFVAAISFLGRKKDQFLSSKILFNKFMCTFVQPQPIRWICRLLTITLFIFTTALPIFAQTITVLTPNGGEIWGVGSAQEITWTSTGTVGKVKIEYSTDNGSSWKNVKASADNTGSYLWTIPDDPSTNCLVKVSEKDGDPSDTSDAAFSIITIIEQLKFVTDKKIVTVPEGGTDTFKVKLSGEPLSSVIVTIRIADNGDPDIMLIPDPDPLELTFTPDNWNKFQTVTLFAAEDDDVINGVAIIQIRAPEFEDVDITAMEQDNDFADISLKLNPHTGTTGNIIKISIEISNNTIPISSFSLNFIYDSTLFSLKSIKKGSLTSDWITIGGVEDPSGTITIDGVADAWQAIHEDSQGALIRIWLKVRCDSFTAKTKSEIKIENYLGGIAGFSPEPCTDNITLVPCSRLGDVNSDGNVTPGDAQSTLEIYLGKRAPKFCQKTTSDPNGDESTTPGDAQDIFDCYLGKKELPECLDGAPGTLSSASFSPIKRIGYKRRHRPIKPKLYPLNTIGYSGKTVKIPIIITNPEGINSFSFEVNYLPELLEYVGIERSQLTADFDLRGIEEIKGLIRVEGESEKPITYNKYASLAIMEFRVKQGVNGRLPIIVYNPGKDLFNVEIDDGTFFGLEYFDEHERFLSLGQARIRPDRTLRIPVKVSSAFNIKSFGLELKYPSDKMSFVGIKRGELTKDFTAVEGNELELGLVRVGAYSMSGIQERKPGTLVELVFLVDGTGGKLEIVELVDDIQDFIIQDGRIRLNEKRDRVKKLWFPKLYDHR